MKILDWYYSKAGSVELKGLAERYSIEISWIIEAGCHDGTDTLQLLRDFQHAQICAFEPDPLSRAKAEINLGTTLKGIVEIHPFGLSNARSSKFLSYFENQKGKGTSSISSKGVDPIETVALDNFREFPPKFGLLWLDVEGHAVPALNGMTKTLLGVDLAKIEVQMHRKSSQRPKDYNEVINIMKKAGLVPSHVPLHPGFFGDIYFVRSELIGIVANGKSKLLVAQMKFLHKYLYPLLGKPRL